MGLDLYHLKATLEPERPEDAFTFDEKDFDEYTLDVLGFRRFMRPIPGLNIPTRIIVVEDEASRRMIAASMPSKLDEAFVVLVGDPAKLGPEVEQVERQFGLNGGERFILFNSTWEQRGGGTKSGSQFLSRLDRCRWGPPDVPSTFTPPADQFKSQHITISYPQPYMYRGLYAEEVGYQRKSMTSAFYTHCRKLNPSARIADVRHTYFFVVWDGINCEQNLEARYHFLERFLIPFEPGRSLIYASF